MRKLVLSVATLAVLAAAAPAAAAPPRSRAVYTRAGGATMDRNLSVWGVLAPYAYGAGDGFGLGMRYQAVVVPAGFLRLQGGVRDELGIEFGADWVHYSWGLLGYTWTYNEISPVVGVAWNFWLNNQLVVYPKIDLAFRFGTWSSNAPFTHPTGYGGAGLELAAGIAYRLNNQISLRAEAGTYALRLGVAFAL